jgi:hypothetical protein
LGLLAAVYAATFVVAVLLHVGVQIPLGFAVLDEPRRPFAVVVEGLAGLVLALSAFAIFAPKDVGVGRGDRRARRRPNGGAVGDGGHRRWPWAAHSTQ